MLGWSRARFTHSIIQGLSTALGHPSRVWLVGVKRPRKQPCDAVLGPALHLPSGHWPLGSLQQGHKRFEISGHSCPECVGGREQTKSLFSFLPPNGAHIKPLNHRLLSVFSVQFRALQGAPSRAFSMDLYHSQREASRAHLSEKIEKLPSPLSSDKW